MLSIFEFLNVYGFLYIIYGGFMYTETFTGAHIIDFTNILKIHITQR